MKLFFKDNKEKPKMKLYTIYTPSHKYFFDNYFNKTLPDEFELISAEMPQECESGHFYKEGWNKTCYRKVELFLKACEENMGGIFLYSDVDIQFFGKIKELLIKELGRFDIACQNDAEAYYNSGFFICKANKRTLKMFKTMKENYDTEDQKTLNLHIHMCKSKFLSNKFFTIAHLINNVWSGQDFKIPYEILVHHANWTEGIENKIKLLDLVREKIKINNE